MARWTVLFEGPRIYNAGHPKGERRVWGLHVMASGPASAKEHAMQVTSGRAHVSSVAAGYQDISAPVEAEEKKNFAGLVDMNINKHFEDEGMKRAYNKVQDRLRKEDSEE